MLVLSGSTKCARGLQNQHCRLVSTVSEQSTLLLKALGVKYSALRWYPSNLCSVFVVVVVVVEIHFVWKRNASCQGARERKRKVLTRQHGLTQHLTRVSHLGQKREKTCGLTDQQTTNQDERTQMWPFSFSTGCHSYGCCFFVVFVVI